MLAAPRTVWPDNRRRNLAAAGLKLAAVAVLVLTSTARRAQASCGDYVLVGGHRATADHHGGSRPGTPACHGPNCQRQSPLPAIPEKAVWEVDAPQWAWRLDPISLERKGPTGSFDRETVALADGHSPAPWRPPSR